MEPLRGGLLDESLHGAGRALRPRQQLLRAAEVVVTNTLPIAEDRHFDKLTVLSIAPLVSRAIREVFEDGSVTSMFDGHA